MKAGKKRKFRRIQEVLDRQKPDKLSLTSVAQALGISYQLVWRTARGELNNRRVLRLFLELGVKPVDLDLPRDMREDEAAFYEAVA